MATQSKPDFSKAFNFLGETYQKLGNYSKALTAFNKAIQLDPYFALAYYNRAITHDTIGLTSKGIVDAVYACELDNTFCD